MEQRNEDSPAQILQAYGRAYLEERFNEIKAGDIPYALVHLNIKNFRYYNTKYSMQAGDEILAQVLRKMEELLGEKEYCGWIYSDNFCLILQYDTAEQLIYERMMYIVDKLYRIEDERIYRNIFYSVGIYLICEKDITLTQALNFANLCRKECDTLFNRSTCMELYEERFYNKYMDRMDLEVATADAYKNYEFVTYLQPKVELSSGQIVGAEALLRWFDKDGNLIPISTYLPILNTNGYIKIIDLDMFDQMCAHMESRMKEGKPLVPVSFNLSMRSFYDSDIVAEYTRTIEKYQIPREMVEIEVTEGISMDDYVRMRQIIAAFKSAGFACALDDFGSGYSSFSVLLNSQVDVVKMDRQFFVENMNGDSKNMVETIVKLIHSLDMKIVAEGVEGEEQIENLRACGCDFVQGHYYYGPMPIDDFNALLDAQQIDNINTK